MEYRDFPITKTKIDSLTKTFNLSDVDDRQRYFQAKVGDEIKKIQDYQRDKTFVGFMVGKKNTGKGTLTKLFMEAVGKEANSHVSIGDIIRDVHSSLADKISKEGLVSFLHSNYRGMHSVEEAIEIIEGRSQKKLISSELTVALIKYEISKRNRKSVFIDGFPRALDQVNYSLYLKDLIGYRDDPDFMAFISVPESVIDVRIKNRRVCPKCKAPRNLRLMATKDVGYDKEGEEFYLMCDDPACERARMIAKEGDELGIEPIRDRLKVDDQVVGQLSSMHGVPQIFLRNAVPIDTADEYIDEYEKTPGYRYELDGAGNPRTVEEPLIVQDDEGGDSYSLLPAAVVVSFIKQVVGALRL